MKYAVLFLAAGLLLFTAGARTGAGLPDAALMLLLIVAATLPLAAWLHADTLRRVFAAGSDRLWLHPLRHCAVKVPHRDR